MQFHVFYIMIFKLWRTKKDLEIVNIFFSALSLYHDVTCHIQMKWKENQSEGKLQNLWHFFWLVNVGNASILL